MRGALVSLSLCKLLKTVASSPLIVFVLASFFQSLCLYKKLISKGHQKTAATEAIAANPKTLIILKVKKVIFYCHLYAVSTHSIIFFISKNLSFDPKITFIR